MNIIAIREPDRSRYETDLRTLSTAVARWFVRRDGKYYSIDNLNAPMSNPDVKQIALERFKSEYPEITLTTELVREVFSRTMEVRHTQLDEVVAVWAASGPACPVSAIASSVVMASRP